MRASQAEWRARPVATMLLKTLVILVPVVAGTAAGTLAARLLPVPDGVVDRIIWLTGVLAVSTFTLLVVELAARRLGPLTLLLRLGLVFPDRAPNRFGMALRAVRPGQLGDTADRPLAAEESLTLLASLLAHDRRTRGHSERVAAYARMIADELGIEGEERSRLQWGAMLHDIGKLEVPARLLTKPAALDDAEWRIMARHPLLGSRLVEPLRPWLGDALSAVDGHHERWDGTGYPHRRLAADLPLAARITAVADAFETMTAARSYKEPMPVSAARAEVAASAGGQFDPRVARAFLAVGVPRLWVVAGPLSWIAQVPVLGLLVRGELVPAALGTAAQGAAAVTGQTVTAAAVMGGALLVGGAAHGVLDGPTRSVATVEAAPSEDPAASPPIAVEGEVEDGGGASATLDGTGISAAYPGTTTTVLTNGHGFVAGATEIPDAVDTDGISADADDSGSGRGSGGGRADGNVSVNGNASVNVDGNGNATVNVGAADLSRRRLATRPSHHRSTRGLNSG